jgi:predicted RNase H-like nuclease
MPLSVPHSSPWVAGADAYPDGWVVVLWQTSTAQVRCRTVPDVPTLLALNESPAVLGLDMIVGLPDRAVPGGRPCDRAARQLLGRKRGTSVFSPPAHGVLGAKTYDEAQRRNRASGPDAPGLSKQTYYLLPRLGAVAEAMTPALQERAREVHPELSFYAMNDDTPLAESKHTDAGQQARLDLLTQHGFSEDAVIGSLDANGTVGIDDVLDAHAACWSARRLYRGTAERCPPVEADAPRNARGLRMEIWR